MQCGNEPSNAIDVIFIDLPAVPRDRNLTVAALFLRFHHIDLKMRMPENCAGMVRLGAAPAKLMAIELQLPGGSRDHRRAPGWCPSARKQPEPVRKERHRPRPRAQRV